MKRADWTLVREAEENGLVVSMTNIVERKRTELNNKLNEYFRENMPNYMGNYDEDKCDDILYNLNEYLKDKNIIKYPFDFPLTEGSDIRLLPIGDNIQLKIVIADEYYGSGDYAKYISIDRFIINENTTADDVDLLIKFVRKYLQ